MLVKLLVREIINRQRDSWYSDRGSKDKTKWTRSWETKIVGILNGQVGTILKTETNGTRGSVEVITNGVKLLNVLNTLQTVSSCAMTPFIPQRRS